MNKKGFIGVAGAILLLANIGNSVNASSQVALTHNAYVYDQNGHRVGRSVLKKNQNVTIVKTKKINGKQYAQIGKNRYIKRSNYQAVAEFKPKAGQTGVVLAKNAYIYDEAGNTNKDKLLKGTSHQVYQVKWIKGKIYYMIGTNQWIKGANVGSLLGMPIYPENTKSESLNTNSTPTSKSSNTNSSSPVVIIQNPTNNAGTSNNNGSSSNNHSSDSGATDKPSGNMDHSDNPSKPKHDYYGLTHVVPVYDETGQHIPGAFGFAGNTIDKSKTAEINGEKFYKVHYDYGRVVSWQDDIDDNNNLGYISESSLENNYQLPTPATRDKLLQLNDYIRNLKVPKLKGSSPEKRNAYGKAYGNLRAVADSIYSTENDIANGKKSLDDAINQLDGVQIDVKFGEKLTPEKKTEIEQQINRALGVSDTELSSYTVDNNLTISCTEHGRLYTMDVYSLNQYVDLGYR